MTFAVVMVSIWLLCVLRELHNKTKGLERDVEILSSRIYKLRDEIRGETE